MNTNEKLSKINSLYTNTSYSMDVNDGKIYLVETTATGTCRYDYTKISDFEEALDTTLSNAEGHVKSRGLKNPSFFI